MKESNKTSPFEMCVEAEIICMELCEARRRGINLICFEKYGNVSQGAGPGNKDGWQEEEGRADLRMDSCVLESSGLHRDYCDYQGLPLASGVESAALRCKLAPFLYRRASSIPRQLWPLLQRETNKSANAFLSWPSEMFVGGKVWLFFLASQQMNDLPQPLKQMFLLGSYFPGE